MYKHENDLRMSIRYPNHEEVAIWKSKYTDLIELGLWNNDVSIYQVHRNNNSITSASQAINAQHYIFVWECQAIRCFLMCSQVHVT